MSRDSRYPTGLGFVGFIRSFYKSNTGSQSVGSDGGMQPECFNAFVSRAKLTVVVVVSVVGGFSRFSTMSLRDDAS